MRKMSNIQIIEIKMHVILLILIWKSNKVVADYVNRYRFSSVGNEMFHNGTEYLLSTLVILGSLQCIAIFAFNAFDRYNIHKP
jgi:hypothetical protein